MILYSLLFVPVIACIIQIYLYHSKVVWWEFLVQFGSTLIVIAVCHLGSQAIATTDTEWWGSLGYETRYYEAYNERVTCRHDKYCTKRNSDGTTSSYVCGKEHSYDVDYHSEYWELLHGSGTIRISESYYNNLTRRWDNEIFKDLRRDYHTEDGDLYYSQWDNKEETFEPVVTKHYYTNKVQASSDVFNFPEVSEEDVKFYGLYDYPNLNGFHDNPIIGFSDGEASKKFQYINAAYGASRQIKVWVLVYKDKTINSAKMQEDYWKGGNKNEFIYCIGIDGQNQVTWSHIISWTEIQEIKIKARDYVSSMGELDLYEVAEFTYKEVLPQFKRKEFSDFEYLKVDISLTYILVSFFIVILINVGVGIWVIKNEYQ